MNQPTRRWDVKVQEQRWYENNREMLKIENAYYDGEAAYSEYSKAISDLLKDPIGLGVERVNAKQNL